MTTKEKEKGSLNEKEFARTVLMKLISSFMNVNLFEEPLVRLFWGPDSISVSGEQVKFQRIPPSAIDPCVTLALLMALEILDRFNKISGNADFNFRGIT